MSRPTVLLIDDDPNILTVLEMRLRAGGYDVVTASDGSGALQALSAQEIDVVLSDLRLEREDGLDVMRRVHEVDRGLPVLILTAHGSIPNAVEAMNRGAAGYLTKPVDREELFAQLARALETRRLANEVDALRRAVEQRTELAGLVGASPGMRRVFELVERFAAGRMAVTLLGERGTGRHQTALAIHALSARANRPFVAVDDPGDLASAAAATAGGTLFVPDVEALDPRGGRALLDLVQRGRGVGVEDAAGARVIAASTRPLEQAVEDRSLGAELAAWLSAAVIHLPPLRARDDDVCLIAEHLLARRAVADGGGRARIGEPARDALRRHRWPGNATELARVVERAVDRAVGPVLQPADLFPPSDDGGVGAEDAAETWGNWEQDALVRLLRACRGDLDEAARASGKGRAELARLVRKYRLKVEEFAR